MFTKKCSKDWKITQICVWIDSKCSWVLNVKKIVDEINFRKKNKNELIFSADQITTLIN